MDEDRFLKKQIRNLNRHLPKGRSTLKKLLEEGKPEVENRDGSTHRFKRSELNLLADIVPEGMHGRLRLPMIIRVSPQLGRGAAKISGEVEKMVFRELLDKDEDEKDELLIYRPEVRSIRKRLPTTTQYAFLISSNRGSSI